MNAIPINVKRADAELAPDPTRVLLRSFTPGDVPRLERIVTGIMSISENDVGPLLDAITAKFSGRTSRSASFSRNDSGNCERWFPSIRTFPSSDNY